MGNKNASSWIKSKMIVGFLAIIWLFLRKHTSTIHRRKAPTSNQVTRPPVNLSETLSMQLYRRKRETREKPSDIFRFLGTPKKTKKLLKPYSSGIHITQFLKSHTYAETCPTETASEFNESLKPQAKVLRLVDHLCGSIIWLTQTPTRSTLLL